jgi:hypothetical protein
MAAAGLCGQEAVQTEHRVAYIYQVSSALHIVHASQQPIQAIAGIVDGPWAIAIKTSVVMIPDAAHLLAICFAHGVQICSNCASF